MSKNQHRKTFSGKTFAVCSCGFTAHRDSRGGANRNMVHHILHPDEPPRVADTPADHQGCTLEAWDKSWAVCVDHQRYVDVRSTAAPEALHQETMSFT